MEVGTKKIPLLLIIAIILLVGVGLAFGYYSSQKSFIEEQKENLDREIRKVSDQIENLQTSEIVSAQRGASALEAIERAEIRWSDVLDILIKVIPLDLAEKKPLVEFTSYSGGEGGRLTFNSHTNPSENVKKQLSAIARTIRTFNESPAFANAFVPSISKSVTQENETILSFIFNVDYLPLTVSKETEEAEEEGGEVPRK